MNPSDLEQFPAHRFNPIPSPPLMIQDLRIALVQTSIHWENPGANRLHLVSFLEKVVPGSTDIVVLSEMFTTGFSMQPERIAESFSQQMDTLQWMRVWAAQLDCVITGSVAVSEHGRYFNRLLWVRPDGSFAQYDKRHLFRMAGENKQYTPGEIAVVEAWRGWRICPLICYDLRFPVWSRNKLVGDTPLYDVLIYVANWPAVRREPWMKLALARAIENQCYVAAVNRIGEDGNGHAYSGDSSLIDPKGVYLVAPSEEDGILHAAFSRKGLADFRLQFPVLNDADEFEI